MTNKQELQTLDKDHKTTGTAGVIHLTTQGVYVLYCYLPKGTFQEQ